MAAGWGSSCVGLICSLALGGAAGWSKLESSQGNSISASHGSTFGAELVDMLHVGQFWAGFVQFWRTSPILVRLRPVVGDRPNAGVISTNIQLTSSILARSRDFGSSSRFLASLGAVFGRRAGSHFLQPNWCAIGREGQSVPRNNCLFEEAALGRNAITYFWREEEVHVSVSRRGDARPRELSADPS